MATGGKRGRAAFMVRILERFKSDLRQRSTNTPVQSHKLDPRGYSGAFLMCAQGRELQGARESADLLVEKMRTLHPELFRQPETTDGKLADTEPEATHPSAASKADDSTTIADELARELAALKGEAIESDGGKSKWRPPTFKWQELCRAVSVVWFPVSEVDITPAINALMEEVQQDSVALCRNVARMIPIQRFVTASISSIQEAIKELCALHFSDARPTTWAGEVRVRNNVKLSKMAVLSALREAVPSNHMVELSNPETTVIVEVCQTVCGVAILPRRVFQKFAKYNLQVLAEKPDERAARLAMAAKTSTTQSAAAASDTLDVLTTVASEADAADAGVPPDINVKTAAAKIAATEVIPETLPHP